MERRHFLPSLFGLIAGAASAARPKPPPAPAPPEPVAQAESEEEDFEPYFDAERARATHTDLAALVADVRRWVDVHPGSTVLPADYPQYRLLGFVASVVEDGVEKSLSYSISLTSLAKTFRGVVDHDLLKTASGRREFCKDLAKGTA